MRDIHCRAKDAETGEWNVGYYLIREQDVHGTPGHFLQQFGGRWVAIDPDTVGMYVGTSIDDARVYEGDIVDFPSDSAGPCRSVVVWSDDEACWQLDFYEQDYGKGWAKLGMINMMQIVGNIHDRKRPA